VVSTRTSNAGLPCGDRRVLPAQSILKTHKGLAKALSGYLLELDNNFLTKSNPQIEGVCRMQRLRLECGVMLVRAAGVAPLYTWIGCYGGNGLTEAMDRTRR
jgi:hypothetical protein